MLDKIIAFLKVNNGACTIADIQAGMGYTKSQVLTLLHRTKRIVKPRKTEDIIVLSDIPMLPERYKELLLDDGNMFKKEPSCLEEELFVYIMREGHVPSQNAFHEYLTHAGVSYQFDWANRKSYAQAKKKIVRMIKECI